ncbi:serine aminopeptidase S33 family [Novosphingobium sp. PhB165]|uniref:esterase/lipase family protein n=1 Tax=Novosphingobium sp. PhB165 TaxID=2485105 RepID=UPI0010F2F129|nr:alpha/beta fold hydrolase [Novosphingobium sp. PhB165]TCM18925.1 serine aminopeptidase S33 family [Novosphingobium sp. PhB165]
MNGSAPRQIGMMRSAIARRAALAREPHPEGVRRPSLRLFLAELASLRRGGWKAPTVEKALHPQPVMLLPGFGAHPNRMKPMAEALAEAGHEVYDWGLGLNLGPNPQNFTFLMRRVGALARQHRRPVALVGWSLGGLFSREIARREPDCVSKVITMGTPFSGDPRANNAWRAYQVVTGHSVNAPPIDCDFTVKPTVPTIALWSPRDGVIHPRSACGWPGERDRAVAIRCSHLGFSSDPRVIAEVLRQLDVEE